MLSLITFFQVFAAWVVEQTVEMTVFFTLLPLCAEDWLAVILFIRRSAVRNIDVFYLYLRYALLSKLYNCQ